MDRKHDFSKYVGDILRAKYLSMDQPNTFAGKVLKFYTILLVVAGVAMISVALSQVYFYGMSYVVHDSMALVPLGLVTLPVNIYTIMNNKAIFKTVSQFESLIDSFPDPERDIIEGELEDIRKKISLLLKVIDYYIQSTILVHCVSISSHYFFGVPEKPVVLPLLYEKFLEGNLQLRPILIAFVVVSLAYIYVLANFSGFLVVSLYVMKAPVGIMKALIHRLDMTSDEAGNGNELVSKPLVLDDIILKHGELLSIFRDMISWNALPLAFVATVGTVFLSLNAITLKQSLHKKEYSSALIWGTFLLFAVVVFYIICSRGQEIERKSEELVGAAYQLPWYRETPSARRNVSLIIAQGNRLIKMNYKGVTNINFATYSEVLQTAYSYFMILTSME